MIWRNLLKHVIKNNINGLIILDKPKGFTSNDCLSIIKKYLHPYKIGHIGTLDENATGVLVCLLGSATKSQDYLMRVGKKVYEAELVLGISTDTEDIYGNVISDSLDKIGSIKRDDVINNVVISSGEVENVDGNTASGEETSVENPIDETIVNEEESEPVVETSGE